MNENLDYDLFLLQETHISCKTQADLIEKGFKGQCFWSFGIGKSVGVAIFVSPKYSGNIIRYVHDTDGRIVSLLLNYNSFNFNIVNLHAPNTVSDRKAFFDRLHTFFLPPGDLILGGDFNCIDSDLDRLNIKSDFSADKRRLSALKSDFCLVDVFRKRNPKSVSYMWSNKDFSQASRLDRFFISSSLLRSVRGNKCFPCPLSDHDFVDLFIAPDNISSHGRGVWKFSCNLLSDDVFMQTMSLLITSEKDKIQSFSSLGDWWDNLKIQIRRTCIYFSSRKRKQLISERNSLTKRLLRAKSAVFAGDRDQISNVNKLDSALEAIYINRECEGAKIRSRARWIEEGEKPTRFFFRLERKRAEKNIFEFLFNESGEEKFSHNDIELVLVDFSKALFSKDSLDMQIQTEIIDDLDLSLSDSERE